MSKRFNVFGVVLALLLGGPMAAHGKETDWSVLSAWCPESVMDCQLLPMHDEVLVASLVDADYRALVPASQEGALSFTALLSVYQSLVEGKTVPDLPRYIQLLDADMAQRTQLYRYALGEGALSAEPTRAELRHYYKELKYLKSLQAINQKQIRMTEDFPAKDVSELKVQMQLQAERLDEAVMAIASQLKKDVNAEEQILRYFIYKREQARE